MKPLLFTPETWHERMGPELLKNAWDSRPLWLDAERIEVIALGESKRELPAALRTVAEVVEKLGYNFSTTPTEMPQLDELMTQTAPRNGATDLPTLLAAIDESYGNRPRPRGAPLFVPDVPRVILTPENRVWLGQNPVTGEPFELKAASKSRGAVIIVPTGALPGYDHKTGNLLYHELAHFIGFFPHHHDALTINRRRGNMELPEPVPYVVAGDQTASCVMTRQLQPVQATYCDRCLATMRDARQNVYQFHRQGLL